MFFEQFFRKLPIVKAQEDEDAELVDPQQTLRVIFFIFFEHYHYYTVFQAHCLESDHCKHLAEKYQTCNDRVSSRSQTTETCVEELFDLLHAVDHCVTKDLFGKLK